MKKTSILVLAVLSVIPLIAASLQQTIADSTGSRNDFSKFPLLRSYASADGCTPNSLIGEQPSQTTNHNEVFPRELKSLSKETFVDSPRELLGESKTEVWCEETVTGLSEQSYETVDDAEDLHTMQTDNDQITGSTSVVFTETFEGAFPGDNWWVGDANSGNAQDYWDDTSYRAASGSWSGWCAQIGDNSVYGGTNVQQRKYDNYMDAYISKKYTVDMSTWDIGYVDFYAWYDTESSYDYLIAGWYSGSSFVYDSNFMLTGTSPSWSRYYWRIPDSYLISSGAFSFSFHSDSSIVKEGTYLDNINLVRGDVTLDNYYLTPTSVHPGDSFTAYYYVNNPCPFSISVGLGLSIKSPGGTTYDDPAHDTVVTLSSGSSSWFSRLFTVPSYAPTGSYSVAWGLWSGTPGASRAWAFSGWIASQLTVESWPDLTWTDIWTDPSFPTGGQNARIYCQIKNQGGGTSTSFTNYFYIDGNYDSYGVNSGLAAGGLYNWYMDRTLSPGYHLIRARADVNSNVQESNEGNNDYTESIWWKGPDLIVVDIWWIDAYGSLNPVITSGQPYTVYFQIKNNGDANAVGTFTSYVFIDGWGNAAGTDYGLAAGATHTWYTENVYVSSTESHSIRAVVDYNGAISEANKDTGSGIGTGETNNERTEYVSVTSASWTVLAYMDADNNLEQYQINDFLSMAQVGSTTSVSILVQLDRGTSSPDDTRYNNWVDCRRFFITAGLEPYDTNAISSLGEVNMGASPTLSGFATWGINRCKAARYLLVIQDHGGSWVGCCWDDSSGGDRLDSGEIKTALSAASSTLGRKLDLVWMNDCLMGSIEVAAQIYPYCDYLAASETVGWTDTWAYNTILTALVTNPTVSPQQYCIQITNLASPHDSSTYVTQSVSSIDLSKTSSLVAACNTLAQTLKNNLHQYRSQIQSARASSSDMSGPYDGQYERIIDLYQIAQNLKNNVPDSSIQTQAQEVMNQIGPSGGSTGYIVMRERHSTSASFCHGLSIYFPLDNARYNNPSGYTTNVDFTSNTQWDEFLVCYYDVTPPSNPNSYTSSHTLATWSSDNTIEVTWSGASDDLSGVYGYSRVWDAFSNTLPDETADQTGTLCISFPVSTGSNWHIHIRTVDNAGNWNPSSYDVGPFYVDVDPPNTPSISETHCALEWTTHNSPYFEWSNPGDQGSGVTGYEGSINGGTPFYVSSPYHPTWSDGIYTFKVRAKDGVGLQSSWSNAITVKIDTTAPSQPSPDDGVSGWSNNPTLTFTWSAPSDLSGIAGYYWKVDDGGETWTTSTSVTPPSQPNGSHNFYVRAMDNAGNTGDYGSHPFQIDTAAPSSPTISSPTHPDEGSWYSNNDPVMEWTTPSDLSGIEGYSFILDGSPLTTPDETIDTAGNSQSYTDVADGTWFFHVRAKDCAGNWGPADHFTLNIGTAVPPAPEVTSTTHPGENSWYSQNDPTFDWTTPYDPSGIVGYSYILDQSSTTIPDDTVDSAGNSVFYIDIADGTWYFHIKAKNNLGVWGLTRHYRVQIDTIPPSTPIPDDGTSDPINWPPTFTWDACSDAHSGVAIYYWKVDTGNETSTIATSVILPILPLDGPHTFYVRAEDYAGNTGSYGSHDFVIDTIAPPVPVISSPTHPDENAWYSNNDPTFIWTTPPDPSGVAGYSYILDQLPLTIPDDVLDTTENSKSYSDLADGIWYFHVSAQDNAGNNGTTDHYRVQIASTTTMVYFDPANTTVGVGRYFNVSVRIAGVEDLAGLDVRLSWDVTLLDYVSHTVTAPVETYAGGILHSPVLIAKDAVNETIGTYWIAVASLSPAPAFNGSGTVVTLTFQAKTTGNTTLEIFRSDLAASDVQPIPHFTAHGDVIITEVHDVAITTIRVQRATIPQGLPTWINATVENQGDSLETFYVTAYANGVLVNQTQVTLDSNSSITVVFPWNTEGWEYAAYEITVVADTVLGETETWDNTLTADKVITVTLAGDVDGDFDVDIFDMVKIAGAYGSKAGDENYVIECDLDGDDDVDIFDLVIAANNYGQSV